MKNLVESDNKIVGNSISFIDIDETTFHTFAKVKIMKNGKQVGSLDNKQFNTYTLKDGEYFNFDEFSDSEVFHNSSKPITPIINKIIRMIESIKKYNKFERIIFLTARQDFNDKELFLKTFKNHGIDVELPNVHIERSGNLTNINSVADRKKYVILKYLKSGQYTAVRMIDDDIKNLQTFIELGKDINQGKYNILKSVKQNYPKISKMFFFPLLVDNNGKIRKYNTINESLIPLNDDDSSIYLTNSIYELIRYAKGFDKLRVLYDISNNIYVCADGYDYIHLDLRQAYMHNYRGAYNNYLKARNYKELDFSISGNSNADMELAEDSYEYMYNFKNELYLYTRDTEIEKTPFYKKLLTIYGKPNIINLMNW